MDPKKPYNPLSVEAKWQRYWEERGTFRQYERAEKRYVLDMFPYPSGAGLHVGHPKGYIATDIVARFEQLCGKGVLHPMGWDGFGLPAEQYALKHKVHPKIAVEENIATYKRQLQAIGFTYDWQREINTTDPEYYRWTQWIFLQLWKAGLAYESNEPINWCPSCKTGLANEDLEQGRCERCGSAIEKRPLRQWVLAMTKYADRLLEDLDTQKLNWPKAVKEQQRHWIGRSEGMRFTSPVKDTNLSLETFSAHFEAFRADTFFVIAPDHPLLPALLKGVAERDKILSACADMLRKREAAGYGEKEVEGIFTGRYTIDPVGNGELPIWIANYALADYGTGIVKCSAHDERDFAFAKRYGIPLKPVLFPEDPELRKKVAGLETCYSDMRNGILSEPEEFSGRRAGECREEIQLYLEKNGLAKREVVYRMRDWAFSRQRYWGEPIPLIHCEQCGIVPVPESDLPVRLPEVDHYEPSDSGESPLANITDWVNVPCPKCGGPGRRETNTMPQWAGSSWYYLRYIDPQNGNALVDPEKERAMMPVDVYVGGAEHATRHLLYARFWHKFLYDQGVVSTLEPFIKLVNVGLILAPDGRKMSKRWGNVINPDEMVGEFGADAFRLYEMFMGPFTQAVAWNTDGVVGTRRFLEKVWKLSSKVGSEAASGQTSSLETLVHQTIKKVTEDIRDFRFNTAVSSLMILVNALEKQAAVPREQYGQFLVLLSPFAPHIAEELWECLGHRESIFLAKWPQYDERKTEEKHVTLAVQINGKVRSTIEVENNASEVAAREAALSDPKVGKALAGRVVKKFIYVPNRVINLVA